MMPVPCPFYVAIAALAFLSACAAPPETERVPSMPAAAAAGPPQLSPPRPLAPPTVPYPPMARELGQEGTVVVRARIQGDGEPAEASVGRSSGYPLLDEAALEVVRRWRFVAARRNGVVESMWYSVPITYRLQ